MMAPVPPRIVRVVSLDPERGVWGGTYWEVWVAGVKVCHAFSQEAAVQAVADFQEVL